MDYLLDAVYLVKFFGIRLIDTEDFAELLIRFAMNVVVCGGIARFIYYPATKRKDYLFTYTMFSVVIFFLCNLLSSVKIEMGFALGLFAIFGIIRYRTDAIRIKEMTYLFIIIGTATVNALANKKVTYTELIFTNFAIVFMTWLFERMAMKSLEASKSVSYEKIELIKPERRQELIADLRERTGLDITKVEIGKIDFLRDTASIRIYYKEELIEESPKESK